MKFLDALKLMHNGNTITRNGKKFIDVNDNYRFTFADKLSNDWYIDNFEGRKRRQGEMFEEV